ncbi:MAG: hypothetical protein IJR63_09225 [Synergistaceae bacterium]|nr:hypothetical protein [Synergistaceae bacterium]
MTICTKPAIIVVLKEIRSRGWVKSLRNAHNDGAIGNTLEDLLGIKENNLPLPNAAEWASHSGLPCGELRLASQISRD